MDRLQAVREILQEEYQEKISKEQGTDKMHVVAFQIQMKNSSVSAKEFLQQIDSSAPIPHPLEGGDGKGPLYLCLLDVQKLVALKTCIEERGFLFYTQPIPMKLDESHYRRDWYVPEPLLLNRTH
jgi:hypothetical protein